MDYVQYINTLVGRDIDNPLITPLVLTKGRLTGGWIYFPVGPASKLHFLARMGVHQIIPFNTGENYRLNDCVVPFHLAIDLLEPPYRIDCVTWNDSTSHPHALTVCFFLTPRVKHKYSLANLKTVAENDRNRGLL